MKNLPYIIDGKIPSGFTVAMLKKSKQHGGKRPGAGRKAKGKVPLFANVTKKTASYIRARAINGKTTGEVIDERFS